MSFDLNSTEYEITWARIQASKAENIFKYMNWSLALIKQTLAKVRITMKKQINKHWKKMIYKINDMMFLNSRNIMIARSSKKLNDKMLESFKILSSDWDWICISIETVIDNEDSFKVHFKSVTTEFKRLSWKTMKWVVWFYSDKWRRWMKSEEHTELQTLRTRQTTAILCQLKRLWRWSTLIQCQWKWV